MYTVYTTGSTAVCVLQLFYVRALVGTLIYYVSRTCDMPEVTLLPNGWHCTYSMFDTLLPPAHDLYIHLSPSNARESSIPPPRWSGRLRLVPYLLYMASELAILELREALC